MRLSAKSRYAFAALTSMVQEYNEQKEIKDDESDKIGECITIISLSEKLKISKLYLEQVFSLLKRGGIVTSVKGSQGGYYLARSPQDITAFDVLSSIEINLFEKTDKTVSIKDIEIAVNEAVFNPLDTTLKSFLAGITLDDIAKYSDTLKENYMYYI
ncbi:MAG: Rrf2 family transcriptional regulator [Lachnospiraceae bacterium]|nr:Rrf2 family transcriptional regulator [Lachnospiraceae bacterium]